MPNPPKSAIAIIAMLSLILNAETGSTYVVYQKFMPPTRPARKALIMNPKSFTPTVLIPMAEAAASSSPMERNLSPIRELIRKCMAMREPIVIIRRT